MHARADNQPQTADGERAPITRGGPIHEASGSVSERLAAQLGNGAATKLLASNVSHGKQQCARFRTLPCPTPTRPSRTDTLTRVGSTETGTAASPHTDTNHARDDATVPKHTLEHAVLARDLRRPPDATDVPWGVIPCRRGSWVHTSATAEVSVEGDRQPRARSAVPHSTRGNLQPIELQLDAGTRGEVVLRITIRYHMDNRQASRLNDLPLGPLGRPLPSIIGLGGPTDRIVSPDDEDTFEAAWAWGYRCTPQGQLTWSDSRDVSEGSAGSVAAALSPREEGGEEPRIQLTAALTGPARATGAYGAGIEVISASGPATQRPSPRLPPRTYAVRFRVRGAQPATPTPPTPGPPSTRPPADPGRVFRTELRCDFASAEPLDPGALDRWWTGLPDWVREEYVRERAQVFISAYASEPVSRHAGGPRPGSPEAIRRNQAITERRVAALRRQVARYVFDTNIHVSARGDREPGEAGRSDAERQRAVVVLRAVKEVDRASKRHPAHG